MTLQELLRRLESSHWPHFTCPVHWTDGTVVYADGGDEIWVVTFFDDGEVDAEVFRLESPDFRPIRGSATIESQMFGRMARAWQEAAADLGVRVVSPFDFQGIDGQKWTCAAWVPDFGGPHGTVIVSREDSDDAGEEAERIGYRVPGLSPRYYQRYDRTRFKETLIDWGWEGEGAAPSWAAEDGKGRAP